MNLRNNQIDAINISIANNFESGVHYHATGTGKSWIAMKILENYNLKYNNHNIMWICEKKNILIEQFDNIRLKERNFNYILEKFNIYNYVEKKDSKWYNEFKSSSKPILLIINRAYLTSFNKYEKISLSFNLIIHDECHSIINNSTQKFYNFMLNQNNNIKCIGFTATPFLEIKPFNKILSSYTIYNALYDKIIVPPKIIWLKSNYLLSNDEYVLTIKKIIDMSKLYYKKIIIWCGLINLCETYIILWKKYFTDYTIYTDTSKDNNDITNFNNQDSKSILFCACKHREGSDIKNLDCCIFLDKVGHRSAKVFTQSIGRVLRKDYNNNKTFGLIIDLKAKSSESIITNIDKYININSNNNYIMPWHYNFETIIENDKQIKINYLLMENNNYSISNINYEFKVDNIRNLFIRNIPNEIYEKRLNLELELINKKNLLSYILQALEILKLTKNIPHVTRGSCGSSLLCYFLGISHVDPIKYNILFSRFLNETRTTLPDIDLDYPYNLRDQVFFKIKLAWHDKVARISNHVYFHEKSALRKAIRNNGIKKFIGKNDLKSTINKLSNEMQDIIKDDYEKLNNNFSHYSLHCGGIVYYPDGLPADKILKNNSTILKQINSDKNEIAENKHFKIDILSSRAVAQLYEINNYQNINFEFFEYDKSTFSMLARGDNIGITLAESPLMRMAFMKFKPNSILDIAICISIIRPASKDANKLATTESLDNFIIFDDDAIEIISKEYNVNYDDADKYRRGFAKQKKSVINEFLQLIENKSDEEKKDIIKKLSNLSKYGFCKAHALSYAQLIWHLAYNKCHNPLFFWKSTLRNCKSSYKKWVHYYEATLAGVKNLNNKEYSVYAENRNKKINNYSIEEQLRLYGYWNMDNDDFFPNCYYYVKNNIHYFNGIIASYRLKNLPKENNKDNKMALIFIGTNKHVYKQINIMSINYFSSKYIKIEGSGTIVSDIDNICNVITATNYTLS